MISGIEYTIECLPEDIPIEGNAMASGDPDVDAETERWIREQLGWGNSWAWCVVKVSAEWRGLTAETYLGGCSYYGEDDFKQGGYYTDMCAELADEIEAKAKDIAQGLACTR